MKKSAPLSLPFLSALLLAGCDASYRDVSSLPEHKELIGKVCTIEQGLRAHGVTKKLEKEKKTDYVSIWNPGFTGPELTFMVILRPTAKLTVIAARECTNCPFDRGLEYQVLVNPEPPEFKGLPAHIRSSSLAMPDVKCPNAA